MRDHLSNHSAQQTNENRGRGNALSRLHASPVSACADASATCQREAFGAVTARCRRSAHSPHTTAAIGLPGTLGRRTARRAAAQRRSAARGSRPGQAGQALVVPGLAHTADDSAERGAQSRAGSSRARSRNPVQQPGGGRGLGTLRPRPPLRGARSPRDTSNSKVPRGIQNRATSSTICAITGSAGGPRSGALPGLSQPPRPKNVAHGKAE